MWRSLTTLLTCNTLAFLSSANNVVLKDKLPENATLVEGSLTSEIGKVTVGSHVKHTYTVVFTAGNAYSSLPRAQVSYIAEADSTTTQVGQARSCT
jgi:translocon-associated protein subunit beta